MKRSFLLTRDISLKDIVNPNERTVLEKSAIFCRKDRPDNDCDPHRELFSGLKYKKIGSM